MVPANRLFCGASISQTIDFIESRIGKDLEKLSDAQVKALTTEDFVADCEAAMNIQPVSFHREDFHISDQQACKVDVSKDQSRHVLDRTRPFLVDGLRVTVSVPFVGSSRLLCQNPESFKAIAKEAIVSDSTVDLIYEVPLPVDDTDLQRNILIDLSGIESGLLFLNNEAQRYNREVSNTATKLIESRKKTISMSEGAFHSSKIPVRLKEKAPQEDEVITTMSTLRVPKAEAEQKLKEHLQKGLALQEWKLNEKSEIDEAYDEVVRWQKFGHALIKSLFETREQADECFPSESGKGDPDQAGVFSADPTLEQTNAYFRNFVKKKTNRLRSLIERLEFFEGKSSSATPAQNLLEIGDEIHEYDAFICHASEDKEEVVTPLYNALCELGLSVWYDVEAITIGDSLSQIINQGLQKSKFGVVVLSPSFFKKQWVKYELDGLMQRQMSDGTKVILPVWHDVGANDVRKYSLPLANLVAGSTADGVEKLAIKLLHVIRPGTNSSAKTITRRIESASTIPVGVESTKTRAFQKSTSDPTREARKDILLAAYADDNSISVIETLDERKHVEIGLTKFLDDEWKRKTYLSALSTLIRIGLVEQTGNDIYELSLKGLEMAKRLSVSDS